MASSALVFVLAAFSHLCSVDQTFFGVAFMCKIPSDASKATTNPATRTLAPV